MRLDCFCQRIRWKANESPRQRLPLCHWSSWVVSTPSASALRELLNIILAFPTSVLCTVRITEPIAFTQIFPYINDFMSDLHVTNDPKRIGFYSGLVVRSWNEWSHCLGVFTPNQGKYIRYFPAPVHLQSGKTFR